MSTRAFRQTFSVVFFRTLHGRVCFFFFQTVSDIREAYRNVTGIVRDTINESARPATTTAAAVVDGDQMMAAGNAMENDIGGAASTTLAPVDQREAGNMLSKLLGRNFRGLRRLFNTELRSAVKVSIVAAIVPAEARQTGGNVQRKLEEKNRSGSAGGVGHECGWATGSEGVI